MCNSTAQGAQATGYQSGPVRRHPYNIVLYAFRNPELGPVAAVFFTQQAVGFFVADHSLRGRVEIEGPAQAIGYVGEVDQRARDVALLGGCVEVFFLAAA